MCRADDKNVTTAEGHAGMWAGHDPAQMGFLELDPGGSCFPGVRHFITDRLQSIVRWQSVSIVRKSIYIYTVLVYTALVSIARESIRIQCLVLSSLSLSPIQTPRNKNDVIFCWHSLHGNKGQS